MSLRLRGILICGLVLLLGFFSVSNFVPEATRIASPVLPDHGLRLGLDLQGGIHWVLGVKLEAAETQELQFLRENLAEVAEDREFAVDGTSVQEGRLGVTVLQASDAVQVREWAERTGSLQSLSDDGVRLEYALTGDTSEGVRRRGMDQVLEVLRRRIADPVRGIPDSVVTRQGDDRVLVQIPGGQIDRSRARELLRVTGFLQFKIVRDRDQTEDLLRARHSDGLPPESVIAFERDKETDRVLTAYLMDERPAITGDYLTDARVGFDRQQRPQVEFQFNMQGGQIFGDLTADNIGEQLAIVLDDRVYSAPTIRSRIGSRGQIEGRFTPQEAADLAVVLRSGSLPIPVEIEEERTVGPALGADSIARGVRASILGLVVIVAFSVAVDANVIIVERIREELRASKTPRAAIATGFNKAFWTIMDANITTLITALVLFEYGTGPIKGFAVTLSIGVVTSVFAALVLTRFMYALYPGTRHVESLSI